MDEEAIINAVDCCIDDFRSIFKERPHSFFTENDLTCSLYHLLIEKIPSPYLEDKNGKKHLMIHTEYAIPKKCDMEKKGDFVFAEDDSRHRRGFFDIVVLNPRFIASFGYDVIYNQEFEDKCLKHAIPWSEKNGPFILYGIEFMLKRKPLNKSQKKRSWGFWDGKFADMGQDHKKLMACQKKGWLRKSKAIFCVREYTQEIKSHIEDNLQETDTQLVFYGEERTENGN